MSARVRHWSVVLMLAGSALCACADARPRETVAGSGGGGRAGSGSLGGANGACEEFCPEPDAGVREPASDAGAWDAAAPASDARAQDADAWVVVDEPETWDGCPPPSASQLSVQQAGSGVHSGCAALSCPGIDLSADDTSWRYPDGVTSLAGFAGCTRIEGDVAVANHASADLAVLSCLEHVTGDLLIWNSEALTSLDGLAALQVVGGDLEIGIHESLHVGLQHVTRIDALSSLRVVGGRLAISQLPLSSLQGLHALQAVGGDIMLSGLPLQDLHGLSALQAVGGSFYLWRQEGMTGTQGAAALRSIAGGFYVAGASDLTVLDGFAGLRCIGENLEIDGAIDANGEVLTRVDGLAGLRYVGGDLRVQLNALLQSAALFSSAPHVGGELSISNNPMLTSLPGLADVTGLGALTVRDNPMLSECAARSLEATLLASTPAAPVDLGGNLPCVMP